MGNLFVIDGTDGSGKQTQLKRLQERLEKEGIKYKVVSFPNYESPSSSLVKMYLSGDFGDDPKLISPYIASTFYAVDRFATYKKELEDFYNNDGIILADRYTTANMVHQAGKIKDQLERNKFLDWVWDFEFNIFGIPKPTEVFFLNMPPEKSFELMKNRNNKFSHNEVKDIHERNSEHIIDSYKAACELVSKYDWYEVQCVKDNQIRAIDDIHEEIYNVLKKYIDNKRM